MSKITRIEQNMREIKSEFSAMSPSDPDAAPPSQKKGSRHPARRVAWEVGIILLAAMIAGAVWFGMVKGGILMTSAGLYGFALISLILIVIMLICRPE
jgi:hypothetical protein